MIPERLFHIWLSDKPESELARRCVESWSILRYPVEHVTLENCDRSEPFIQQALAAGTIEGRVKANDYLRVKYLYERGGIYMDNDVEVLRPFGRLMDHGCFLGAEDDSLVNMAVLGAEPGNWFLGECLARMREFRGDGPETPVKFSLGTTTDILRRHGWSGNREFEKLGVRVLPSSAFYPVHWSKSVKLADRDTEAYTIHHWNMSWNERVSVVIPCYNYGHFLGECLESIALQTYPHMEVIVVDDGSTDNTQEVIRHFQKAFEIKSIRQENRGLSAARNSGIRAATGKYIQPLDADDKLSPAAIERCVEVMEGADIVCPGQQEFGDGSKFYRRNGVVMTLQKFLEHNRIHCASMFRKKAWAEIGGYDEAMRDGYEDWDFWVRMLAAGHSEIRVIDEPMFFYRIHSASMLRNMKPKHERVVAAMRGKYRAMGITAGDAKLAVA